MKKHLAILAISCTFAFAAVAPLHAQSMSGASTGTDSVPAAQSQGVMASPESETELQPHAGASVDVLGFPVSAVPEDSPVMRDLIFSRQAMQSRMLIALTEDMDVNFALYMLDHHVGMLMIAEAVIENADDPDLVSLSADVLTEMEDRVARLNTWLEDKGY